MNANLLKQVRDMKLQGLDDRHITDSLAKDYSQDQITEILDQLSYMHNNSQQERNTDENKAPDIVRKRHIVWKVLAIIIVIGILFFGINYGSDLVKTFGAEKKVSSARKEHEQEFDKRFNEQKSFIADLSTENKPITSSKKDVCYVTHSDSGFFATNWYQDCYIRYVQVYMTSLSKDEVQQKVATNQEKATLGNIPLVNFLFGEGEWFRSDIKVKVAHCTLFTRNYTPSVKYISANFNPSQYDYSDDCERPSPLQDTLSVKGPIVLDNELSVQTYSDLDENKINNSENQIWIMYDAPYYHEELGCGLFLCDNPRSRPVHPSI